MRIRQLIRTLRQISGELGNVEMVYPHADGEGMQKITTAISTRTGDGGEVVVVLLNPTDPLVPKLVDAARPADWERAKLN